MKKLLMLLACAMAVGASSFAGDEEVTVKVSVAGVNNSALRKQCEVAGKKAAIKKYLIKQNDKMPEKVIDGAMASYAKFIEDIDADEAEYEDGSLTCSYTVTVKPTDIAEWLKGEGVDLNAGADGASIEIFVMEEPPDAGQIQLGDKMGNFFLTRYNKFQRTIRDLLVADADKYGFNVVLLEDNENYEEFKQKDPVLVGVSYDVNADTKGFVVTEGFLRTVQDNNPNAIAMYYRIDGLTYNPGTKKMRISVALNIKNLADNSTKSLGSVEGYEMVASGIQQDEIMVDFGKLVKSAMQEVLDTKGAGKQIAKVVKEMRNKANRPKGPLMMNVNANVFDAKIRKKVLYTLKKKLIASKVCKTEDVKMMNNTLRVKVSNPAIDSPEDLYMEHVSPILEEMGAEITDDQVKYSGRELLIRPGQEEAK